MATKRLPRPRDPIQLGELMVDIATGPSVHGRVAVGVGRIRNGGFELANGIKRSFGMELAAVVNGDALMMSNRDQ